MARYVESRKRPETDRQGAVYAAVPVTVVGMILAAALSVLLLLSKSQLSQMGFEISALERELEMLETCREKLLIAHARAYSLERVEQYAMDELGMVHPNPDQYRFTDIESAEHSPRDPGETTAP